MSNMEAVPGGNGTAAPGEARDGHGRDLVFVGCCHPKAREPGYVGPQLTRERMERVWPRLVGCPLLDNHKHGNAPIGRVVSARVDGEHQLWIQGQIDESTPEGARVAALIRSGEYGGLSLGMQHRIVSRASGAPPRAPPPGEEVEAGWEDVEAVVWSDVFEISVCPKGKYPNTHLFFTFASEDASEGGDGGITLVLDAAPPAGAGPKGALPFSTGWIIGEGRARGGRAPFASVFRAFTSPRPGTGERGEGAHAPRPCEKTASTVLNPNSREGSVVRKGDSRHHTRSTTTTTTNTTTTESGTPPSPPPSRVSQHPHHQTTTTTTPNDRSRSSSSSAPGNTMSQQQQTTSQAPAAAQNGGTTAAANPATGLAAATSPAQAAPQQQQQQQQTGAAAAPAPTPQGNGASLSSPPSGRPSPVPRYSDGKFAPYRTPREGAPPPASPRAFSPPSFFHSFPSPLLCV